MTGRALVPIAPTLDLAPLMAPVALRLLGEPNKRLSTKTEWRYGSFGSLSVDIEMGTWFDHERGVGGGVLDLVNWKRGLNGSGAAAIQWLRDEGFLPKEDAPAPRAKIVATYDYVDENGEPLFQVVRFDPKRFLQRRRPAPDDDPGDVRDGWVWEKGRRQVPFRLPELIDAISRELTVFVVEGEKDANNCWKLNVPATTNAMGGGKWPDALNEFFRGADVVIIPDNDKTGKLHAMKVGNALAGIAARLRVLDLPGLKEHGDISDWIAAGGTAPELYRLAETARPFGEIVEDRSERMVLTSREFVAGFVPPDYAIDGIAQRSFIYSLTGSTGSGKTAILLLIAYLKAKGLPLGKHEMDRGRVLICAGENPTDARQRWIAMAETIGFDLDTIDVFWIDGRFNIDELFDRVAAEVKRRGAMSIVFIDTSAAYNINGDDENNNTQQGNHARTLRRFTSLEGSPCVIVACHPTKNAASTNLLPRGGGAFLAEMDGNFTVAERDGVIELHWQGKLRGPDFLPIPFQLDPGVKCEWLKDAKGRLIRTVVARLLTEVEQAAVEKGALKAEDEVLVAMFKHPGASLRELAAALGWGEAGFNKVRSKAISLAKKESGNLTKQERGGTWGLTAAGKKVAEEKEFAFDLAAARRGDK